MIKFRPHHLLCSRFFIGKGYSLEFTENMKIILSKLKEDNELLIVSGKDDLCSKCPFMHDVCDTKDKTDRYDKKVLELLNINYGDVVDYNNIINDNELEHLLESVCPDCEWHDICVDVCKKNYKCD